MARAARSRAPAVAGPRGCGPPRSRSHATEGSRRPHLARRLNEHPEATAAIFSLQLDLERAEISLHVGQITKIDLQLDLLVFIVQSRKLSTCYSFTRVFLIAKANSN